MAGTNIDFNSDIDLDMRVVIGSTTTMDLRALHLRWWVVMVTVWVDMV